MDLLSTVRKSGSRGGVNFSWDEVANSSHRENYLGHSLKAPVGRWQQGRDLNWYAKADAESAVPGETDEERRERERKEELRKVKEAEEDAMAAALGLPPPQRNTSGANAIEVEDKRIGGGPADQAPTVKEKAAKDDSRHGRSRRHEDRDRRDRRRHRSRSRSRDRRDRHDRHRQRERSRDRADREERKPRQDRSRSQDRDRRERRHRDGGRERSRDRQSSKPHRERRRSYSPRESRR